MTAEERKALVELRRRAFNGDYNAECALRAYATESDLIDAMRATGAIR